MPMTTSLRFTLLMLLVLGVHAPLWASGGLFGMIEIKASSINAIPKWVKVLGRIQDEGGIYNRCKVNPAICVDEGLMKWGNFIQELKGQSPREQMEQIHAFINRWPYITDNELWGVSDYWETPKEFVNNSGDCEDYAIAKYMSLKALGWPLGKMRLAVVQDTVRDIPHAILIVELEGRYWVLDNLVSEPVPDSTMSQYKPYYAVNETSRWVFVQPFDR
jgi:predicted transglutaminase-like cysteine proteinase